MAQAISKSIPPTGFVRIKQILHFIPISPSAWWAGVASGKYPRPIKLGTRTTVWRAEDIHELIATLGRDSRAGSEQSFFATK